MCLTFLTLPIGIAIEILMIYYNPKKSWYDSPKEKITLLENVEEELLLDLENFHKYRNMNQAALALIIISLVLILLAFLVYIVYSCKKKHKTDLINALIIITLIINIIIFILSIIILVKSAKIKNDAEEIDLVDNIKKGITKVLCLSLAKIVLCSFQLYCYRCEDTSCLDSCCSSNYYSQSKKTPVQKTTNTNAIETNNNLNNGKKKDSDNKTENKYYSESNSYTSGSSGSVKSVSQDSDNKQSSTREVAVFTRKLYLIELEGVVPHEVYVNLNLYVEKGKKILEELIKFYSDMNYIRYQDKKNITDEIISIISKLVNVIKYHSDKIIKICINSENKEALWLLLVYLFPHVIQVIKIKIENAMYVRISYVSVINQERLLNQLEKRVENNIIGNARNNFRFKNVITKESIVSALKQ